MKLARKKDVESQIDKGKSLATMTNLEVRPRIKRDWKLELGGVKKQGKSPTTVTSLKVRYGTKRGWEMRVC